MDGVCNVLQCDRYSTLRKLLHVTVLDYVFCKKSLFLVRNQRLAGQNNKQIKTDIATPHALQSARDAWVRYVQSLNIPNEIDFQEADPTQKGPCRSTQLVY